MSWLSPEFTERSIDLQGRSFQLLQWLEVSLKRGTIRAETSTLCGTSVQGAKTWLTRHYENIPADARVEKERLSELAGFFVTYLSGTFELNAKPGRRRHSDQGHCFCPCCSFMVDRPHLRPRKVTSRDKNRAQERMRRHLLSLGLDVQAKRPEAVEEILADREELADAALCTYVADIAQRQKGTVQGGLPLALWRTFAWTSGGSPRKKWRLTAAEVTSAQERLVFRLGGTSPG